MSTVLVHERNTSVTSGFFGYLSGWSNASSQLIETLKATAHHASHPLFLPVVALDTWVSLLRQDTYRYDNKVRDMQKETRMMEAIYDRTNPQNVDRNRDNLIPEPDYEQLHSQVVQIHNRIASSIAHFVHHLGNDIAEVLTTLSSSNDLGKSTIRPDSGDAFQDLVHQLQMETRGLIHMRERISARLDMQAKVVSTID